MSVVRTLVLAAAAALTVAATPASAQFFLKPVDMEGARVTGEEPGVATQALPGATPAERRAAVLWNLLTWWLGLPTSSSHALIGGFVGAALVADGPKAIITSGLEKTATFIVVSPLVGLLLGLLASLLGNPLLNPAYNPLGSPREDLRASPRCDPRASPRCNPRCNPRASPRCALLVNLQGSPHCDPRGSPQVGRRDSLLGSPLGSQQANQLGNPPDSLLHSPR